MQCSQPAGVEQATPAEWVASAAAVALKHQVSPAGRGEGGLGLRGIAVGFASVLGLQDVTLGA